MSDSKKVTEKEKAATANETTTTSGAAGAKSYAGAVKTPQFGIEMKDSLPVFEVRLLAPQQKLSVNTVIQELSKSSAKSSLFGVRFMQRDIIASFRDEQERNRLVARGSIKVQGISLSLSTFPLPLSRGTKHFLCDVPMVATGAGVAKGLEPLKPTKWFFEHHTGTHIRTGRVVFWTEASSLPDLLRVVDVKCPIKTPGQKKEKKQESKEVGKQQQRGTPLGNPNAGEDMDVVVEVPAVVNATDVVVPDARIFDEGKLDAPSRTSLLTIYEDLVKAGDAEEANKLIPTPLKDKVEKTQSRVDIKTGYNLYNLSTFNSEEGAVKALEDLKRGIENHGEWEKRGWIHFLTISGTRVLVIFKTRIAKHIKKQNEK